MDDTKEINDFLKVCNEKDYLQKDINSFLIAIDFAKKNLENRKRESGEYIYQNNINVGLQSEDDLRIDAALIAQKGRVGRFFYSHDCSATYYKRQTLTLYGMIATYLRYGFAFTDGTGYQIRNLNYDANLLYAPPPSFPLTSDQYVTLSWEEIK